MSKIRELRSTTLPTDFLNAELIAAPLVSERSLRLGLTALDPRFTGDTAALWRGLESPLLSRFPGMSVDELVIRRDLTWFGESRIRKGDLTPLDLGVVFKHAFSRLIRASEGYAHLDRSKDSSLEERRRKWRWLTFALPADFVLASIGAAEPKIDLISPSLSQSLSDRSLAETHLHLKAAISFSDLWSSALAVMADSNTRPDLFASPGAALDEGLELGPWLLRAAVVRILLARFLVQRHRHPLSWRDWLQRLLLPTLRRRYGARAIDLHLNGALVELSSGRLDAQTSFSGLLGLYRNLSALEGSPKPQNLEGLNQCDPIHREYPASGSASPEFRFLQDSLKYLSSSLGKDRGFARLFWQLVRIRVAFYRHMVQRPMTPGLQWFTRTYDRLKPARKMVSTEAFLERAARLSGAGLRSLEVRIASEPALGALKKEIEAVDRAASELRKKIPTAEPLEVGVVIHFPRYRATKKERIGRPVAWGREIYGDPEPEVSGYSFSEYFLQQRPNANALAQLLRQYPRTLEIIRGIDLCTDELAVPLWVLRPLLVEIREAGFAAAKALAGFEPSLESYPIPPLRTTIHSGEDWVHLLGGIRRVAECIEFLEMAEGDRIGHGVALGVDPAVWAQQARIVYLPKAERLLDLIWTWKTIVGVGTNELGRWLPKVEAHLAELSQEIFGEPVPPESLKRFYRSLHETESLRRIGFPNGPKPSVELRKLELDGLLLSWLRNAKLYQRGRDVVPIDVEAELELILNLQARVRDELGARGVTIEINPSSNLLIGNLGDLTSHSMWRLRPPMQTSDSSCDSPETPAPSLRPLHVCIGSDDPITFSTGLREEYQLLLDSMVAAGMTADAAEQWLDEVRQRGLSSRFTVPRSKEPLNWPRLSASRPDFL